MTTPYSRWSIALIVIAILTIISLTQKPSCVASDPTPESYERAGYDSIEWEGDSAQFNYRPCVGRK